MPIGDWRQVATEHEAIDVARVVNRPIRLAQMLIDKLHHVSWCASFGSSSIVTAAHWRVYPE
jgi:hypothetical protein